MAEIIDYLEVMAREAAPVGLVLYNPPHAKKKLSPEEFGMLRQEGIPLVGCKVAGGSGQWYQAMKEQTPGLSIFVPVQQLATGLLQGASGAYSSLAFLHPGTAHRGYQPVRHNIAAARVRQDN